MKERTELHCHTKMSAKKGAADIKELIRKAENMGIEASIANDQKIVDSDSNSAAEMLQNHRVIIFPKNKEGMRELYRMISMSINLLDSHWQGYSIKFSKDLIAKNKRNLLIGSCAIGGEVSSAVFEGAQESEIRRIIRFYDFTEVEPPDNYMADFVHLPGRERLTLDEIKEHIKKIVRLSEDESVPVVASANVYYVSRAHTDTFKAFEFVCGKKSSIEHNVKHHLMSAKEMLKEFSFLGYKYAEKIVIENPEKIAGKLCVVRPVSSEKNYPLYPDAELKIKEISFERAHELYGEKLPEELEKRLQYELNGIIDNGFTSIFMIAYESVKASKKAGHLVGFRGSAGSSLVSYLLGITEINPLPAHYKCDKCGYSDFDVKNTEGYNPGDSGVDLPDKECPVCKKKLSKAGHDIPVETFLGFRLNKEPDFDLVFSSEYTKQAQKSLADISGIDHIYRAGTICKDYKSEALSYANRFSEKNKIFAENSYIADKPEGVKIKDINQDGKIILLPNGVDIYEYTPVLPGHDFDIDRTLMQHHSFDGLLLDVDILGDSTLSFLTYLSEKTGVDPREIKTDDREIMSLFSGTEALGITPDMIGGITAGTLGVPEFGSTLARALFESVHMDKFSDIIKMVSMLYGVGTWKRNAEKLIKENVATISDCIAGRDDIMLYLVSKGIGREESYNIMEYVRKGRGINGLKGEWKVDMLQAGVPEWYIDSCEKIDYLYPKANSIINALLSCRLLYYKLYYPKAFYSGWLKYKAQEISKEFVRRGYDYAKEKYEKLSEEERREPEGEERYFLNVLTKLDEILVIMEMYARGIKPELTDL